MEELNTQLKNHKKIEVKESRAGSPVPVVKGIYLHSIYSPTKEAQAFARDYEESLKRKNSALDPRAWFWLSRSRDYQSCARPPKDFKVTVLEPNAELISEFKKTEQYQKLAPYISIVHSAMPEEVFEREEFIMFLTRKPAIIKHDPSYNLSKTYFQGFLTYKASTKVADYRKLLSKRSSEALSHWEGSLDEGLENVIKSGRVQNKNDYALFLMRAIVESTQKHSRNQ